MRAPVAASQPDRPRPDAVLRVAGPIVVLGAALVMLAWTWRYCPDPVIDFGRDDAVSTRDDGVRRKSARSFQIPHLRCSQAAVRKSKIIL